MYWYKKVSLSIIVVIMCFVIYGLEVQAYTSNGIIDKATFKMIKTKSVDVRKYPTTDAEIVTTAHKDQQVVIVTTNGDWYKILVNGEFGWVKKNYLTEYKKVQKTNSYGNNMVILPPAKPTTIPKPTITPKPVISQKSDLKPANISTKAPTHPPTQIKKPIPTVIPIVKDPKLDQQRIQVIINSPEYTKNLNTIKSFGTQLSHIVKLGNKALFDAPVKSSVTVVDNSIPYNKELSDKIVAEAKKQLGIKYLRGGKTPKGFDSSGLVQYIYGKFGYNLKRKANEQSMQGTTISKKEVMPGDLVFFDTTGKNKTVNSVGLYIGDNTIIFATSVGNARVITSKFVGSNCYTFCITAKRIV